MVLVLVLLLLALVTGVLGLIIKAAAWLFILTAIFAVAALVAVRAGRRVP